MASINRPHLDLHKRQCLYKDVYLNLFFSLEFEIQAKIENNYFTF